MDETASVTSSDIETVCCICNNDFCDEGHQPPSFIFLTLRNGNEVAFCFICIDIISAFIENLS